MIITYRNIAVLNIPSFKSLIYDEQLFVVNLKIPNASFKAIYLPSTSINLLMNRNLSKEDWSKGDLQKQKENCQKKKKVICDVIVNNERIINIEKGNSHYLKMAENSGTSWRESFKKCYSLKKKKKKFLTKREI